MLPGLEGNILFWLDAHFPGADHGLRDYNAELDEQVRCPLESELEVISRFRAGREDVFIIDDLRLYLRGTYENGNLHEGIRPPPQPGIDFIYRLFGDSHHIIKLNYDEGYVLLLPIEHAPNIYVKRDLLLDPDSEIARLLRERS